MKKQKTEKKFFQKKNTQKKRKKFLFMKMDPIDIGNCHILKK